MPRKHILNVQTKNNISSWKVIILKVFCEVSLNLPIIKVVYNEVQTLVVVLTQDIKVNKK